MPLINEITILEISKTICKKAKLLDLFSYILTSRNINLETYLTSCHTLHSNHL